MSTINSSLATALWSTGSSTSTIATAATSADLLISYYNTKAGITTGTDASGALTGAAATTQATKSSPTGNTKAPTAPWLSGSASETTQALVKSVLSGGKFIRESSIAIDMNGASSDYKALYTYYQGVNVLNELAKKSQDTSLSDLDRTKIEKAYARGIEEVQTYIQDAKLDHLNLIEGALTENLKSTVKVAATNAKYTGLNIQSGSATDAVAAFAGDVKFSISVKRTGKADPVNIDIDLSEMGSTTRSMSNVTTFINDKLKAAGLSTRFQVVRTAGEPTTITVGTKTVTTSAGKDSFAFGIKGDSTEALTFSAPATASSLYVVQTTGKETTSTKYTDGKLTTSTTDTYSMQLLKFQSDESATTDQPSDATQPLNSTYWTSGLAQKSALEDSITAVRASAAAPDGGVYVLADVAGTVDGQTSKGAQDVALIKYDSTGQVVFTRTLGASETASGYNLAVSSDGHVAVVGSVTGAMNGTSSSSTTTSDSFVTMYDASGVEQWTSRINATKDDEALGVAFGPDNSVIVGGRTKSVVPGATTTHAGGWDAYTVGFDATGKKTFATQTGTAQTDSTQAMTVSGNTLYVVNNQNGEAVLSSYDLSSGEPTLTGTRNLGGLGGGSVSSVSVYDGKVYVGGISGNGNMLSGASVTRGYSGGTDAFALSVDADLSVSGSDKLAYYGGSGTETGKVMFADGKAWISASSDAEISGTSKLGKQDGVVARLNLDSGDVEWSQRYTGTDGTVNPNAVAVSSGSSSVLDKLGLPTGTLLYKDSTTLAANTSVRAGDQFYIRDSRSGAKKTITIEAGDTLETLATKITRASGYNLKVTVNKSNGQASLSISPNTKTSSVEFLKGPSGKDALESLGISDGLVKEAQDTSSSTTNVQKIKKDYGLSFDATSTLSTEDNQKAAQTMLEGVMAKIKSATNWLRYGDGASTTAKGNTSGTVPAYLTNQISNYQAALQRLTGGA